MKHSNPVSCDYWADKLMVRPDALSAEEQNGLREHITICADCREQYLAVQQLSHDLQSLFVALRPPQREARLAQIKAYHAAQEETRARSKKAGDTSLYNSRSVADVSPWYSRLSWNGGYRSRLLQRSLGYRFAVITAIVVICIVMATMSQVISGAPGSVVQADPLSLTRTVAPKPRDGSGWVHTVAWSPTQDNIIASLWSDNIMEVWDANTDSELFHTEATWGTGLAWSPDGKSLATIGVDGSIDVFNVAVCRRMPDTCNPVLSYKGHTEPVNAIAWSSDGSKIASASSDKTVQVWDSKTGKSLYTYRDSNPEQAAAFNSIAWSPNSQSIVSGDGNGHVQVWKALTGELVTNYTGQSNDPITSVSWSSKGNLIASAGYKGIAHIWNASTGKTKITISSATSATDTSAGNDRNEPIYSVAWSSNGEYLALASDNTLQVRQASTGIIIGKPYHFPVNSSSDVAMSSFFTVAWSPDGRKIVCGGEGAVFNFKLGG